MSLNLNHLRIFYHCAKHRTFSEAAEVLFLSQPAVTMQIKQLESHLGMDLFHRHSKTIKLTEIGDMLFEYTQRIFELTESAENAVKELKNLKTGNLRIGSVHIYARLMMPSLILDFQLQHPGIRVFLDEGSSDDITQSLIDYKNELGLISAKTSSYTQLEVIPLFQRELVLILAGSHPLNRKDKICLADLADEPLIVQRKGAISRESILHKYQEAGIVPPILIEARNYEFIIEQVQAGKGISFISAWGFKDQLERGTLKMRTLAEGPFLINVDIAHLKKRALSPAARAFMDLLLVRKNSMASEKPATSSKSS